MKNDNDLMNNIDKIYTTALGIVRIKRNLEWETSDVVSWCKREIKKANDFFKMRQTRFLAQKRVKMIQKGQIWA